MYQIIKERSHQLRYIIAANLISWYVHFMGFFTKYISAGSKTAMDMSGKQRTIYAFWHNQQSFMLYPYRKHGKICVLVSMSKDGEFIARALPKFKMKAMRGSTTRGGYSALRGLMDITEAGYCPAITPDGPRGPLYKAHAGIVYLAQKTHLPILAVGAASSRKMSVNSWDKFQVPFPFGKCALVYAEPLWIGETDDIKEGQEKLSRYLNDATAKAEELVS
jgi:Uncharacterized protein conserved in bacteria